MPQTLAADKAGWARLKKVGPYFYPHKVTCGAGGLSNANSLELPTYPYPIFMAYAAEKPDLIYSITKAMIDGYAQYKDSAPGADGLDVVGTEGHGNEQKSESGSRKSEVPGADPPPHPPFTNGCGLRYPFCRNFRLPTFDFRRA